jgi:hypothetical protein
MIFSDDDDDKFNWWLILMIWPSAVLVTSAPLSPTKKRTLFSRLSLSESTISLFLFLAFARRRTSKISTFEKASKSSHFRSDNKRQISLDLSLTCRYRKRLISLINYANFFEIITFACYEYSEYVDDVKIFVTREIVFWSD